MLPMPVKSALERALGRPINRIQAVGGGSINETACIETADKYFFVKWNNASRYPGMYSAEEKGLALLRTHPGFTIPEVIVNAQAEQTAFLVLEFLQRGQADWQEAGRKLAQLHSQPQLNEKGFGLGHDNYIGSLQQRNTFHATWPEFFSAERILPQVKLAMDNALLSNKDLHAAEHFCKRIADIFPEEKPALLHGDLWSGNMMFTTSGPAIFDPAVYWGHREMDLAMTKLFGGFDAEFYDGYNEFHTLEKNWEQRIDYCNLYPLLVHVNLFGGSYVREVRTILASF